MLGWLKMLKKHRVRAPEQLLVACDFSHSAIANLRPVVVFPAVISRLSTVAGA